MMLFGVVLLSLAFKVGAILTEYEEVNPYQNPYPYAYWNQDSNNVYQTDKTPKLFTDFSRPGSLLAGLPLLLAGAVGLANFGYTNLKSTGLSDVIQTRADSINRNIKTTTSQGQSVAALEASTAILANSVDGLQSIAIAANATGSSNTAAILRNAAKILTNAANIRTSDGKISTNAARTLANAAKILTNEANILTNTGNIQGNRNNIGTNSGNIANNLAAIGNNTKNIKDTCEKLNMVLGMKIGKLPINAVGSSNTTQANQDEVANLGEVKSAIDKIQTRLDAIADITALTCSGN